MLPKNDKIERKSYVLTPVANAKNITSGGFKKVEVVNNSARQIGTQSTQETGIMPSPGKMSMSKPSEL